jgi:hypothetical protein
LKTEVVPKVALLPTYQKILAACASPHKITFRPDVVISVVAICIIKMTSTSPCTSKVTLPDDTAKDDVDLYSPGVSVQPPMFPDNVTISVKVLPAALLQAAVKSNLV